MLIITIDKVKEYVSVNQTMDMKTLKPSIMRMERKQIIPCISNAVYDDLQAAVTALPTPMSPLQLLLLAAVEPCLVNFTLLDASINGYIQIDNGSMTVQEGDTKRAAPQWAVRKYEDGIRRKAYEDLEDLYLFMEEHTADYPAWTTTPGYTLLKECFVSYAADVQKVYDIGNSRLIFLSIKNLLLQAQRHILRPVLGVAFYNELLGQYQANNLTQFTGELADGIREVLVFYAIKEAMITKAVAIEADGIVANELKGGTTDTTQQLTASDIQRSAIWLNVDGKYEEAKKRLKDYLETSASITVYPTYFGSDAYIGTGSSGVQNAEGSGLYFP